MSFKFYRFSVVQSVAPREIRAEIICSLVCSLLDLGVIHACKQLLKNPTNVFIYRFQGIFIANIFTELAVDAESKNFTLNNFYKWTAARFQSFFFR